MGATTKLLNDGTFFTEDICDLQRHLFQTWDLTGGYMDETIIQHHNDLVLFGMPDVEPVPKFLHIGRTSLAGRIIGAGWRQSLKNEKLDGLTGDAYLQAAQGDPVLQQVEYETIRNGIRYNLAYKRFVFRCRLPSGVPFLVTYSSVDRLDFSAHRPTNRESPVLASPRSTTLPSRILLGADGRPIGERAGAAPTLQ